jgi:hypothetical protein
MNSQVFRAFVKEAMSLQTVDVDTPPDYVMIKAAVTAKFKIANSSPIAPQDQSKMRRFKEGVRGEAGPAIGATLGAGLASAYNVNPVAGAAAGYGIGAIPEIIHGIRHR